MSSVIVIVAPALCAIGFSATVVIALGRTAARADAELERDLAERRAASTVRLRRQSRAGAGAARATIVRDPAKL